MYVELDFKAKFWTIEEISRFSPDDAAKYLRRGLFDAPFSFPERPLVSLCPERGVPTFSPLCSSL